MNWLATAVAGGGVDEIKPFSQEALARQDEIIEVSAIELGVGVEAGEEAGEEAGVEAGVEAGE
jgi:hypothetical protein